MTPAPAAGLRARALRLLGLLFGIDPIVRKEFYGMSRRWQTYAFRVAFVGLMGAAVAFAWLSLKRQSSASYSAYAQTGRMIFMAFAGLQLSLGCLAAVLTSADMIAGEVRRGTLGILALTPLSRWWIVYGKWKACMAHVMLFALASLPILSVGTLLGGTGPLDVLITNVATVMMSMLCAAFGLLCSTFFRGYYACVGATIGGLGAYSIVGSCCGGCGQSSVLFVTVMVDPAVRAQSGSQVIIMFGVWLYTMATQLALAWLCLFLAATRLKSLVTQDKGPGLPPPSPAAASAAGPGWFGFRAWAERSGVWDFNPYLWREVRGAAGWDVRAVVTWAIVGICAIFLFVFLVVPNARNAGLVQTMYAVLAAVIILTSAGAGATAFTKDKEEKRWEVLMTTPLSASKILWAKMACCLMGVWPYLATLAAFVLSGALLGGHMIVPPVALSIVVFSAFAMCVGLLVSLACGTTRRAAGIVFGLVAAILIVVPTAVGLHASLEGGSSMHEAIIYATNPFSHLAWIRSVDGAPWGAVLAFAAVYGSLACLALAVCRARFDRLARETA